MIRDFIEKFLKNELNLELLSMEDLRLNPMYYGKETEYLINAVCIDQNNPNEWTFEYFLIRSRCPSGINAEIFHMPLENMKCLYALGEKIKTNE